MQSVIQTDPISYAFSYINTDKTRYQYVQWLRMFFDEYLGLPGKTLEEKAQAFLDKARADQSWAQEAIMQFLSFHKDGSFSYRNLV